nr:putative type I restriction enzyme, DNA specificity subunit [uncultured archaeon]
MKKPYLKYKDSGIEWIGEIPEHWEAKPIKYVGDIVLGKMLTPDDKEGYFRKPYLRAQNITWEKVDTEDIKEMWFSEKELSQYRLKENDLLVSEGGEVGRTAIWQNELNECYIQNSVHKITIKSKNNPHYYLYHFQIYGKTGYFDSIVNRVSIAHLTREKLKEIMFLSPTFHEQQTIANYLDRKTHQIDTFIENKQKLIDLLKEQRAAIINQAVTKGLNPNVKLKDSGIEWLGEIPEHWELRKVGRSFNLIGSGTTPKSENIGYYENGTINWVITGDLNDGILDKTSKKITEKALDEYSTLKIYPVGTLLIAMYGATIGKISLMNFEGCVNQACCALSNSPYLSNEFSFYWFLANKQNIINMSFGGGQPNISQEVVRSLKIPTPPSSEQQAIIYHLDEQTTRIDKLMERQGRQIEHLKEYRTTLISEVVTGKIDVRDYGIPEVRPS